MLFCTIWYIVTSICFHSFFTYCWLFLGKLVRRQRLPKNDVGAFWSWKDLNVAMNLPCYGRVFRIYDCDRWTRVCTDACLCVASVVCQGCGFGLWTFLRPKLCNLGLGQMSWIASSQSRTWSWTSQFWFWFILALVILFLFSEQQRLVQASFKQCKWCTINPYYISCSDTIIPILSFDASFFRYFYNVQYFTPLWTNDLALRTLRFGLGFDLDIFVLSTTLSTILKYYFLCSHQWWCMIDTDI